MEDIAKRYPASLITMTFAENAMPVFHAVSNNEFNVSLHLPEEPALNIVVDRHNGDYRAHAEYLRESIISVKVNNVCFDIGAFSDKYAPINIISKEPIEAIVHSLNGSVETKKCIRMPGGYRSIFVAPKDAIVRIIGSGNGEC